MSKSMEDVLAAHMDVIYVEGHGDTVCCHDIAELAQALTAAGFGNLHDAWAEGLRAAVRGPYPSNPYPTPKVSET